ncbi:thioesterase family protein [Salinisphaera sp. P385]|uniref:Thioesterase family protein n=1 Tax=Spectribacter acetivorans TaxID=3075603 RepID=A0ABU3B3S6_9GAMM|nr:thioesterase family protein [Salinisphaera sp. P385]MDT0617111.1 thioesterase family protein [Salinisphaera sp. P385]
MSAPLMTADAFFEPHADHCLATPLTRGPWSPDHQHGGPPAALTVRAMERALPADPAMQMARVTFELLRPVPIGPLAVTTEITHAGRKLHLIEAVLAAPGGPPLIRARGLAMRVDAVAVPAAQPGFEAPVAPADADPFEFPFFTGDTGYHTAMETRLATGEFGSGRVTAWMRMRVPLVAGEAPSPLQRVVVAADSGNGVSLLLDVRHFTFVNPDLTVYLHRMPRGEWVALEASTRAQANGIGLADTRLHDEAGVIGRSDQSLLIAPR